MFERLRGYILKLNTPIPFSHEEVVLDPYHVKIYAIEIYRIYEISIYQDSSTASSFSSLSVEKLCSVYVEYCQLTFFN